PLAAAVAFPCALECAFISAGTDMLGHLELHERLCQRSYPLTQAIDIVAQLRLAHELLKCHAEFIGHLVVLLIRASCTTRGEPPRGRSRQPTSIPHTPLDTIQSAHQVQEYAR